MTERKLANGYVLSDEEIESRVREWEDGTWKGSLVELRVGRPRLSDEPNANLSFKCPESGAQMIEQAAKASGMKKPRSCAMRPWKRPHLSWQRRPESMCRGNLLAPSLLSDLCVCIL